jgi:uncharacterized membrane protein YfcA
MVLLYPKAVPVTPLLLALLMTSYMAIRERGSIDVEAFFLSTSGRALGAVFGVGLLKIIPAQYLSVMLGLFIIATALLSFFSPNFEPSRGTQVAGGMAAGITGTIAAIGGTPLALVYQDRQGPELRATLAISFVAGIVASLVVLTLAGRVDGQHLLLALELLPAVLVGLWASRWVIKFLDERWVRPSVLAFAALAGAVIVVLGLQG